MSHGLIGRVEELALLEDLLADHPVAPAVFVHGPGGIGKSALLHEMTRRAQKRGLSVLTVDGRDHATAQREANQLAATAADDGPTLVVVDAYEHIAALGALLRADLGASVGVRVRLLIAGRRPPESAWFQGGWEHLLRTVELGPVPPPDARRLLERRGLRDPQVMTEVARWADGSPLALGVAADAVLAGQVPDLSQLDRDGAIAQVLLRRLAGDELEGADREVLAVAAIARAVDSRLLASVLPGVDADRAEAWLRGLSFAEPFGVRLTLHERVRAAARGALLATDRDYEHELRRGIADHLYGRGVLGELRLLPEIAELIDDPAVRWGASPPHAADHRCGPPAPGDADRIGTAVGVSGTEWWAGVRRWFDESPEHVTVVRDSAGEIAAGGVAVTPASAPYWAAEDRVAGPVLADAESRYPDGDIVLLREAFVLPPSEATPDPAPAVAAGNTAILLGSGLRTVRAMYVALSDETPEQREFMRALGNVRLTELDIVDGERTVHCYLNDMGPGGIIGFTRKLVYRDLGRQPPPDRPAEAVGADAVREALRTFHDPGALAASPLARGGSSDDRAASVRRLLQEAVAGAFGDSQDERLLRSIIEQAYFVPDGGHARAEQDLHMSRTTYYRRLRTAVVRVCDQVLDARVA